MTRRIDLNADLGERPAALADGSEEALLQNLTSASIACGGHAGDATTMAAVIVLCQKHRVAIGAHPSYPDRANFGRAAMELSGEALAREVTAQVSALVEAAAGAGALVRHVKPHGALYNVAAGDAHIAAAIARGVRRVDPGLRLVGLAGSQMLRVWQEEGFAVAAEAFADRRYEPDGTLRPRRFPDAVITDPVEAAEQVMRLVEEGVVIAIDGSRLAVEAQTICIHSDTENAVATAAVVRRVLLAAGVEVARL